MTSSFQAETVSVKLCLKCNAPSLSRDKFCRRCGIFQGEDAVLTTAEPDFQEHKTSFLDSRYEIQSISRRSLDTLRQSAVTKTGSLRLNRFGVFVIAMLLAIPMWLLIILLSPLDAYLSARAASNQMSIQ